MEPDSPPVVLITGARKGIGRYLAERYAARGCTVYGCSRGEAPDALVGYTHFTADVTDEAAMRAVVSEIRQRSGRLDTLINNAGIASMNAALLTPVESARRIIDTNLLGTFICCREAAKLMLRRRRGRIVNFSTVAVPLKLEGEAIYAASKAGVESLTSVLAREFGPYNITVNAVGPTPVRTDLIRSVPEEALNRLLARQALPRFAVMEDVANIVDFFISPASAMVTGQTLYLGGV